MVSDSRRRSPVSVATAAVALLFAVGALAAGCSDDDADDSSGRSPAPTAASSATSSPSDDGSLGANVPEGVWAGEQLILTVTEAGATAEFECAAGVVAQPLALDPSGQFDAAGTYAQQSGGPVSSDDPTPEPLPAHYRGRLSDATHMSLDVVLPTSGTTEGPFDLELGGAPSLERCV